MERFDGLCTSHVPKASRVMGVAPSFHWLKSPTKDLSGTQIAFAAVQLGCHWGPRKEMGTPNISIANRPIEQRRVHYTLRMSLLRNSILPQRHIVLYHSISLSHFVSTLIYLCDTCFHMFPPNLDSQTKLCSAFWIWEIPANWILWDNFPSSKRFAP